MVGIYAALIGAAVALLLRVAWEVPEDLRQHDRRMKELDEDLETWVVDEGAIHRLYRLLARRPFRTLEGPDRVQPVLDRWRATDGNGEPGGFPDPSRLTLDNLLGTHPSRNPWC